jgi:hypothetical protein
LPLSNHLIFNKIGLTLKRRFLLRRIFLGLKEIFFQEKKGLRQPGKRRLEPALQLLLVMRSECSSKDIFP